MFTDVPDQNWSADFRLSLPTWKTIYFTDLELQKVELEDCLKLLSENLLANFLTINFYSWYTKELLINHE